MNRREKEEGFETRVRKRNISADEEVIEEEVSRVEEREMVGIAEVIRHGHC